MKSLIRAFVYILGALTFTQLSHANVCGTDFQNFNPSTSGLDFVTVHSSETLKPCILNAGFFLNYAANTLSYSQTFGGAQAGTKANDRILGADLSLGFGLTQNWDFGVNVPFVVSQQIKDDFNVAYYDKTGATEVKLNTKYRFWGDDAGGLAGVFSVNQNLIQNNPFSGDGSKPTLNFELAADTTVNAWAMALNLGYRKRTPGDVIPNQPFLPLKDQYIYSGAASYLMRSLSTKLIFEVFGASAVKSVDYDSNRSLNSLEGLVGIKHDYNHSTALHFGGSTKLGNAIGSPDWRVYAGINWAFGPICNPSDKVQKVAQITEDPAKASMVAEPEIYRLSVAVLFDTASDEIKSDYSKEIDDFMTQLKSKGFKKLKVSGHTDSVGAEAYNLSLSQRRAESVKDYIVQKFGVSAKIIETEGFGESQPIADNGNYQGRQQNRRVEFQVWR